MRPGNNEITYTKHKTTYKHIKHHEPQKEHEYETMLKTHNSLGTIRPRHRSQDNWTSIQFVTQQAIPQRSLPNKAFLISTCELLNAGRQASDCFDSDSSLLHKIICSVYLATKTTWLFNLVNFFLYSND